MANIKISSKGKALLSNRSSSAKVVDAVAKGGEKLYTKEGIVIMVDGKQVRVKAASPVSHSHYK